MKKYFLLIVCIIISLCSTAQDFPYAKMLKMSDSELEKARFKYNQEYNQWVLKKFNGLQVVSNILGDLGGTRRDKNDYVITIQKGDNSEVAYIDVRFYNDEIFHTIVTFAKDNGNSLLETTSGELTKFQFAYDNLSMVLQYRKNTSAIIVARSQSTARSIDDSFNEYHFTINTSNEPKSDFINNQRNKDDKRNSKGKKQRSAADFM